MIAEMPKTVQIATSTCILFYFSPTVVYSGDLELESDGVKYMNYKNCGNLVQ